MLGFPIRTPPDHSLVANSPGLIAGSNVLHRLLMPRHPPCALHSLSQQRQDNTHKETTPAHPPIKEADQPNDATRQEKQATPELILEPIENFSTSSEKLIELLATSTTPTGPSRLRRCSRPLCRSQTTTPPTPSTTTPGDLEQREDQNNQPPKRLILQDPTVCLTPSPTNAGP